MFGKRSKLTQLVRLIPFCERNYNLIELGPKEPANRTLLGVLTARHPDLRRRGYGSQAVRETLPERLALSATGIASPSTSLPESKSAWTRPWSTS
jgi:hypothetical protein